MSVGTGRAYTEKNNNKKRCAKMGLRMTTTIPKKSNVNYSKYNPLKNMNISAINNLIDQRIKPENFTYYKM